MAEVINKLQYENNYIAKGITLIAGVDEVGRGPLAGPVVCAAVIMPLNDIIDGVDDSKKLSEKKRANFDKLIKDRAIAYSICQIEADEIDQINILEATKKCMVACINSLKIQPQVVLVDALKLDIDITTEGIIKGDAKSYSIACASIIAKQYRDNLMIEYSKQFTEYGFEKHKGYGTKTHIQAIKEIGPCSIHRRTFIKNFWAEQESN